MKSMNGHFRTHGFSLIEVLLAVAVLSFGLLALATLQVNLMQSSGETKAQSVATSLAKDKLEDMRTYANINGYLALTDSTAAETVTVGGIDFSRTWTVVRYGFKPADSAFASITSDTATSPTGFEPENEFKKIGVSVSWSDATGTSRSITLEDAVASLSPSESAKLAKPQPTTRPRGPEVLFENPEATAGVIPIALGNGSDTAATNPRPIIVSQGSSSSVVETRFDVLTYIPVDGSTAVGQQRVKTAVVGCTCSASANSSEGFRPAYWDGLRYVAPSAFTYTVKGAASNVVQSDRCIACCRDHRDPSGVTGAKFDPRRTDGHKHFNSIAGAEVVTGTYRESCRMIEVDGFWRVAPDLYNDYFGTLATGSSSSATTPSTSQASNYENLVLDYLGARYVSGATSSFNSPSAYISTLTTAESARAINEPAVTAISAATAPKWTHSRGLYIDNLEKEVKDLIEKAKTDCGQTNACVLKFVPFTSINLTEIADWQATLASSPFTNSTTNIQVSNNSFATTLSSVDPVKGKVLLGSSPNPNAQGNAKSSITGSNAGVALFAAVDADGDSTALADSQTFEIGNGTPPVGGGVFSLTMSGAIASPVDSGTAANPPKVTFTMNSIGVDCSNAGLAVLPFTCTTTNGQSIGTAATVQVLNYNRQDNVTVQNSCTNSPNDTASMPFRVIMGTLTPTSNNAAATISGLAVTNAGAVGLPAAGGEFTTFNVNPVNSGDLITVAVGAKTYMCPSNYATYITDTGDDAGKSPDNGNSNTECSGAAKTPAWSSTYVTCPGAPLQ